MSNSFNIYHQWKTGSKSLGTQEDIADYILDINIDRRSGTNVNECKLNCDAIPYTEKTRSLFVRKSITNSSDNIITDPMNKFQIYINGSVQFTGWLINYKINSDNQIVELTLHDNSVLLKRGLNVHPQAKVTYTETYNTTLIIMLGGLLGLTINVDSTIISRATLLDSYVIENGQNIYDALSSLCESLDAVLVAEKDGTLNVKPSYTEYTSGHDFDYSEYSIINSAAITISGSQLKPTIMVTNNSDSEHKKAWMFTDNEMLTYLNGWDDIETISSDLAINQTVAKYIAHQKTVLMWRAATSQDILTTDGESTMDLDKIIQTTVDDNTDVYRVIGLNTTFNASDGYRDKLTLECVHAHDINYLGDLLDCKTMRTQIIAQAKKYLGVPFNPDQYYRTSENEWGMCDEALITNVLIDLGYKDSDQITASQNTIKSNWCVEINKSNLMEGDIIAWPNDCKEMGFYLGDNKIIEVWGSVISNMTATAMSYCGYYVKIIEMSDDYGVNSPSYYRLKELEGCSSDE